MFLTKARYHSSYESQGRFFLPAFIETQTTVDGKNVTTSKLFDWFKDDFIEGAGSVGEFLATYLPAEKATLEANDSVYIFTDYSWALNEQ